MDFAEHSTGQSHDLAIQQRSILRINLFTELSPATHFLRSKRFKFAGNSLEVHWSEAKQRVPVQQGEKLVVHDVVVVLLGHHETAALRTDVGEFVRETLAGRATIIVVFEGARLHTQEFVVDVQLRAMEFASNLPMQATGLVELMQRESKLPLDERQCGQVGR